jgi:hypothetical protein
LGADKRDENKIRKSWESKVIYIFRGLGADKEKKITAPSWWLGADYESVIKEHIFSN